LNLCIALIKLGKIKESEIMILETLKTNPETFYIIIPQFYNAAKKDKDIASIVLKILKTLKEESLTHSFTIFIMRNIILGFRP